MTTRLILLLLGFIACVGAQETNLKLAQTIFLVRVKGRFDHFSIDVKGQRLFVAALGNDTVEVIDIAAGKRLKSITGVSKPQGVLYLPAQNQVVVASGNDGTLKVFEGTSYELIKSIGSLEDADNVRFDAKANLVYVGYGDGGLAVFSSVTWKQTGNIKLAAHPESFQLETENGRRIFVNVPDAQHVAVLDREKQSVTTTWRMTAFQAHFPMALDGRGHQLFVGCRKPARLVVLDAANGTRVADLAIDGDTDDLFYDSELKRIYISCGEGFIDAVKQRGNNYELHEKIPTRAGARTSFFSPDLKKFFLAVPARGGDSAEIRVFETQK